MPCISSACGLRVGCFIAGCSAVHLLVQFCSFAADPGGRGRVVLVLLVVAVDSRVGWWFLTILCFCLP